MKCEDVYLHICDHLDEEIDSPRCRAIKHHLETCPHCKAYLASVKKTITLYRALPEPVVPTGTHRELLKTITTLTGQQRAGRTRKRPRQAKP